MYTFHDDFEERKIPTNVNVVPKERILLPFYYLRLIGNSIRDGESITPILYIPKSAWTQDCKEISMLSKKCQWFKFLSDLLQCYTILMGKNAIHPSVFLNKFSIKILAS